MDTPFLTQDELLYLVLLIFQYEISYTASGGFTTLHRLHAICSVRPEATEVMAPFWAEYFDVASDDSAAEPSLACDFEPASAGSR